MYVILHRLRFYGESPMDMRIPPLNIKIMFESNPPKSGILVRRSAVDGMGWDGMGWELDRTTLV